MQINIIVFGQLTEITGCDKFSVNDISDTENLITYLHERYPALKNYKFAIAVEKKIINGNTGLTDQCMVALLPPFSGG